MLSWFALRHSVDLLIGLMLVKRFESCPDVVSIWHELGEMTQFEQIGIVAAIIILVSSLVSVIIRLGKALNAAGTSLARRLSKAGKGE